VKLDLMQLLGPTRPDPVWQAERAGWRCYVFGNGCGYRAGTRLAAAWERGFAAAARSSDPTGLML
jgi:hypothetical protein